MRRLFGLLVLTAGLSSAGTIDSVNRNILDDNRFDDPLHGYCAGTEQCMDNEINSPTSVNPPSLFGFTISPAAATESQLLIDFLEPNNEAHFPVTMTGTYPGTAALFSASAWTTGDLAPFLGITASPANPIGAFIPDSADPGATGFFVYQLTITPGAPGVPLHDPAMPNVSPLQTITSGGIPLGAYIVGFLNIGTTGAPTWEATANSGAILETSAGSPVPEPRTTVAMIVGSLLMVFVFRKKAITE